MSYTSPAVRLMNTRFVDVNFREEMRLNGLNGGYVEMTSEQKQNVFAMAKVTPYGVSGTMIPQSRWIELIKLQDGAGWLEHRLREMKNQGSEGSCVGNATTTAHQVRQAVEWGDDNVRLLSAISLYRQCASGPKTGSNLGDVMRAIVTVGALPLDTCPRARVDVVQRRYQITHPATGYYTTPTAGWKTTAAFFRVDEWWSLSTLDEIVSASLCGYPVIGGRDGHCVCFLRWLLDGSNMFFTYVNSWGAWGDTFETSVGPLRGFGYDSKATVSRWAPAEAWCPRTIIAADWVTA